MDKLVVCGVLEWKNCKNFSKRPSSSHIKRVNSLRPVPEKTGPEGAEMATGESRQSEEPCIAQGSPDTLRDPRGNGGFLASLCPAEIPRCTAPDSTQKSDTNTRQQTALEKKNS